MPLSQTELGALQGCRKRGGGQQQDQFTYWCFSTSAVSLTWVSLLTCKAFFIELTFGGTETSEGQHTAGRPTDSGKGRASPHATSGDGGQRSPANSSGHSRSLSPPFATAVTLIQRPGSRPGQRSGVATARQREHVPRTSVLSLSEAMVRFCCL